MGRKKIALDKDEVAALYFDERWSFSQIAAKYHVSSATILHRFREWGLPSRTISEAMKGHKTTWGAKIGDALRGRKLSEERRRKISQATMGRPAWNKGLSKASNPDLVTWGCSGEKHWNWKGGISAQEVRLRQSSEYKEWRRKVFERDRYTCVICGQKGGKLVAHHVIPFSVILQLPPKLKEELLWAVENGWTLCEKCHKEIHKRRDAS